jgi:hypothetical protein
LDGDEMLALKIAFIIVGILFICFGYAIYFKGKYNLINGVASQIF